MATARKIQGRQGERSDFGSQGFGFNTSGACAAYRVLFSVMQTNEDNIRRVGCAYAHFAETLMWDSRIYLWGLPPLVPVIVWRDSARRGGTGWTASGGCEVSGNGSEPGACIVSRRSAMDREG
jgi:hypothetical protein